VARNGAHVTYLAPERRGVVLEGAALWQTRGLGTDLVATRADPGDPLRARRPVADWPAEVTRVWRQRGRGGAVFSRAMLCRLTPAAAPATVEVKELSLPLVEVREACASPHWSVEQVHWADAATGRVWKTRQWAGPETGMVEIEVIRPAD
jgi:Protein of unknown function (DUF2886).